MSDPETAARWQGEDLELMIRVQPRARRDELVGIHGGRLKVRLTAPPVEGKANAALTRILADAFGVAKSRVRIASGHSSRDKRVRIQAPSRVPGGLGLPGT